MYGIFQKEKDLELAAKIGQSLLEQNRELQQRNEFLEEQIASTNDRVTQLKHEVQQKADLIHVFAESDPLAESSAASPTSDTIVSALGGKVKSLEGDNSNLKLEVPFLLSLKFSIWDEACWEGL